MTLEISSFQLVAIISVLLLTLDFGCSETYRSLSNENPSGNVVGTRTKYVTPMHKALLTQRGYIQFLRWELPVPEIEEFTFCVWVKSTNLTYPHSIFSYSKDEKDRLVRAWISSYGRSIHLEINNVEIFQHPTYIMEHRWYHICESWDNADGRYALWIDGKRKIDGYAAKMAGHVIPSKGDIVLGQEYTDFDKGLEEGIEGAVLGFNLILVSAFQPTRPFFERNKLEDVSFHGQTDLTSHEERLQVPVYGTRNYRRVMSEHPVFDRIPLAALGYSEPILTSQQSSNSVRKVINARSVPSEESRTKRKSNFFDDWEIKNSGETRSNEKPLGQQLVEMSYEHCEQGRGSPRIGGKLMLISWTRTPVRVFGGAIIKNAKSNCGEF